MSDREDTDGETSTQQEQEVGVSETPPPTSDNENTSGESSKECLLSPSQRSFFLTENDGQFSRSLDLEDAELISTLGQHLSGREMCGGTGCGDLLITLEV